MNTAMLNGVSVYPFRSDTELIDYADKNQGILVAINAEKILHATPETRAIINRYIGYCDGAGAVMALKKKGYKDICRIPGCELWLKIVERCYQEKTFYLVGGKPQIIGETVEKLKSEYPGIRILGYRDGYIKTEAERNVLIEDIIRKKPDIIFVAMGSPKQELLMEAIREHHRAVFQGLGGSFDVYTGHVKRAPQWWRDHNLEGLYRIIFSMSWQRWKRLYHAMPFWWLYITNKL